MWISLLLVAALGAGDSASDAITFRDGKTLRGQVVDPSPRGKLVLIVRRAWAETNLPERSRIWTAAEAPSRKRARDERIRRLEVWKKERIADPNGAVLAWIDGEVTRLKADGDKPSLMTVTLNRADVRKIEKRPPDASRLLRLAWKAGFEDAESRPLDSLRSALEGRGIAVDDREPVSIDNLLPTSPETEMQWRTRRAATEVTLEPKLRFVSHLGLLLPEGANAQTLDLGAVGGLVKGLLGDGAAEDPIAAKMRELAAKGRVGLMVTTLETSDDLSAVKVEIVLYARVNEDRWERAAVRTVRVRGDELRPGDGANIGEDPQVKSLLKTVEGLGLAIPDDLKAKGLKIGAATQKALGMARTAIQPDLDSLNLVK